ncbi:MAG: hypothetical protein AAB367_03540 [Patescibacteria group bacterium]
MNFIFGTLYLLAGMLLAIPYCLLAGWDGADMLLVVAFAAPAFLFVWFMAAIFAEVIRPRGGTLSWNWRAAFTRSDEPMMQIYLRFFWGWTLYSLLPIILHWSAALLDKIGFEKAGSLINMHRYASSFYIFMAALVLFIIVGMVMSAWDGVKRWTSARC